jgi:1,4-dihydroxy-2-naphthoate octaprenyltransferase
VDFYLQAGYIHPIIHWMAAPVGLTIFNVILLNEFLDYAPDTRTRKTNLVVRLGRSGAVRLYSLAAVLSWIMIYLSVRAGIPRMALLFYVPVFAASAVLLILVIRGSWRVRKHLEHLCGVNIAVNLGTTMVLIASLLL